MATMIVHRFHHRRTTERHTVDRCRGGDKPFELRGVLDRALALPESVRLAFLLRELNRERRGNT
jgi:Mg2+/Co2+ transporter CorC